MAKPVMSLKLDGVEDLEAALKDLGERLGKAALERAMAQAARPMLDAARRNTPRDSGDLEESLTIGKRLKRRAPRNAGAAAAELYLGPDLSQGKGAHAHLVEMGTGPRYTKDGRYTGEMPPDPFLRPAFDAEAAPTIGRLKAILAAEIEKSAKRKARRQAKARGWEV